MDALDVDHEVHVAFGVYRVRIKRVLGPRQRLSGITDCGEKSCGALIRPAVVLHCCRHPDNPASYSINGETIAQAIQPGRSMGISGGGSKPIIEVAVGHLARPMIVTRWPMRKTGPEYQLCGICAGADVFYRLPFSTHVMK